MVKLLDDFTGAQTFNLVPSLITQIQEYVSGEAQDPFLQVVAKSGRTDGAERRFALQYLFQANPECHRALSAVSRAVEKCHGAGESAERGRNIFRRRILQTCRCFRRLDGLTNIFGEKDIAELIRKGRNYTLEDQRLVIGRERELLGGCCRCMRKRPRRV